MNRGDAIGAVATVQEMGWSGKKNGELIQLAREQFDVFMTADQNMQHQQRLAYSGIAVIVLVAQILVLKHSKS